jgi:GT2 family glycosyltransferase
MVDLSVIIVSLNTCKLLAACLGSVYASTGLDFEVFVVDNGSRDGSAEMVLRDFPLARVIRNPSNRGFAAANNVALDESGGRHVLLLNPDTLLQADTLRRLVEFLDAHPDAGICGPKVFFPDGRFQSCGYRFPTLLREIRQSRHIDRTLRWLVGEEPPLPCDGKPFEVDWVDGCCLAIKRAVIDQIGRLDEQYFLYAEELDWCFRARRAGWAVYALPNVAMIHYQGQSSSQMSDFSLTQLVETRLRYYRKNHGLGSAFLVSLVYVAGGLRQIRRSRSKQAVKLRATMRWWRSLLAA